MLSRNQLATWGARIAPGALRSVRWLRPRYPLVALELRENAVVAVRLKRRSGGFALAGHGERRLRPGVFAASLTQPGVNDPAALAEAIADALRLAGAERANRVAAALPDTAVRVFTVDLAELPPARGQADELVRFRIRKSLPFRPEEARVSWHPLSRLEDGRVQVLVAVTLERLIRAVEAVFGGLGARCGLFDVATLGVLNALRVDGGLGEGVAGDAALINATPTYFSILILRDGQPIFYRSKTYQRGDGEVEQQDLAVLERELRSTLGYYEEHLLGEGLERTHVRPAGGAREALLALLSGAGCGAIEALELQRTLPELRRLPPEQALGLLPAIGVALRRQA